MSTDRIRIRCPNCEKDGSARAELLNRRVSCKHCSHVFRVIPVADASTVSPPQPAAPPKPPGSAASARQAARQRIQGLEVELKRLRDDLSAQSAEHPAFGHADAEAARLKEQLARALDDARLSQARAREAEDARIRAEQAQEAESESHRGEVARVREERVEAEQALRKEIARLKDQLDETVLATPGPDPGRSLEDENRLLREDLAQAREAIEARLAEHAQAIAERDKARTEARAAEARRSEVQARRLEAEAARESHAAELEAIRDEIEAARAEAAEARRALDELRADRERAEVESTRSYSEVQGLLARAHSELGASSAVVEERDRLAGEFDAVRVRVEAAEAEAGGLRDELAQARGSIADAEAVRRGLVEAGARIGALEGEVESIRRERDEARIQRDRLVEELETIHAHLEEAEHISANWGAASTEMEVPRFQAPAEAEPARDPSEVESLRAELAGAKELIARREAELSDRALDLALEGDRADAEAREAGKREAERGFARERDRTSVELEELHRALTDAVVAAEAVTRERDELAERVKILEAEPVAWIAAASTSSTSSSGTPTPDPAELEATRMAAADEAVKGAWADFERRLSETQAKLKAANARADLLEAEAREALEQIAAFQKGLELGDFTSFEDSGSMTSIRILSDRGTARLTLADAEARIGLARQLAVERKDKALIDRIAKMAGKVRDDLESKNYTLAETLVRGAEIEVGLDPGGYSIKGLKIFRPSPSIVTSLIALAPALERVMKQGDLAAIRSTIGEMRTILGDQAGLPEIRRPGRTPAVKRPITPAEATRLFLGALEGEQWLTRPIAAKRPLPDTSLTTYAALARACVEVRPPALEHAPEGVELLDEITQAACAMMIRRQQADGHFPFLDPRGKPSKFASIVEAMVAQSPLAVKDGWVVAADPSGVAQVETAECASALLRAAATASRPEWAQAALKAADWAAGQPCLTHFAANAASADLLARAYLEAKQDRHLGGLVAKLTLGLLPGQSENGRWVDAASAQTPHHLSILRALLAAWEALPDDGSGLRSEVKSGLDRAADSLLHECQVLGVPTRGGALRELLKLRDLTRPDLDPRLGSAILDSVTAVQELCHDGPKPRLGVAPDQLAALVLS